MHPNFDKNRIQRFKRIIKILAVLFLLAVFLLFLNSLGIRIPCIFYKIFGLKCPGCGTTRMCLSILRGDLAAAVYFNKVVPFLTIPLCLIFIRQSYIYIIHGNVRYSKIEKNFFILALIALLIYGVIRNISQFQIY